MGDFYKNWILTPYKFLKQFPKDSKVITSSSKNEVILNNEYGKLYYFWKDVVLLGIVPVVLLIILIAALINYEVLFRLKARESTKGYSADYYTIKENETGLYFYLPLLSIVVVLFFVGMRWGYHKSKG